MNERSSEQVAEAIRRAIFEHHAVAIEGLGVFRPSADGFTFESEVKPAIFISYVREDSVSAVRLSADLRRSGGLPWLDTEKLLPGQDWKRTIDREIQVSDFFVPLFSRNSSKRRSPFHEELRRALECSRRLPLGEVFLLPVRLDECKLPELIEEHTQHVDLFPDWAGGIARIKTTVAMEMARRLPLTESARES